LKAINNQIDLIQGLNRDTLPRINHDSLLLANLYRFATFEAEAKTATITPQDITAFKDTSRISTPTPYVFSI